MRVRVRQSQTNTNTNADRHMRHAQTHPWDLHRDWKRLEKLRPSQLAAGRSIRQHTPAQHTSAHVSIRQLTPAYVSSLQQDQAFQRTQYLNTHTHTVCFYMHVYIHIVYTRICACVCVCIYICIKFQIHNVLSPFVLLLWNFRNSTYNPWQWTFNCQSWCARRHKHKHIDHVLANTQD